MEVKDIRGKTREELEKMLEEAQSELRSFRYQLSSNQLNQVHKVGDVRKLIARIKTILSEQKEV
jgi:large subunit ribosomal protein L29